jgi:hypothetical protein
MGDTLAKARHLAVPDFSLSTEPSRGAPRGDRDMSDGLAAASLRISGARFRRPLSRTRFISLNPPWPAGNGSACVSTGGGYVNAADDSDSSLPAAYQLLCYGLLRSLR